MLELLSEPFTYDYMLRAMTVGSLVGGICAFLSAYIILKGWSLIGDALSHSVVPGVALAYMLGLPFAIGAFFAGGLAATTILFLHENTKLKQDTIIGLIFTSFFGFGLFLVSVSPIPIDVRSIFLGNILSISPADMLQLLIICAVTITCLAILWKDFLVLFFDELHAQSLGQNTRLMKVLFFTLLSASTVAALQTVGAFLVIAMVIIPGATAYLLSDRFEKTILISSLLGVLTSFLGAYLSYFLDAATGGIIVCLQGIIFFIVFFVAPKYGYLSRRASQAF